MLIPCWTEN